MNFARKVWKLLVGIKDAMVLALLLLFFFGLFAILSARPSPGEVREGALLLALEGSVVEEAAPVDPLQALITRSIPSREYQARDLVRAIDAAADDDRVKSIALDLSGFTGGGQVQLQEVGSALDRFRQSGKKVHAWSLAYADPHLMLASHADEVWVDPLGGAVIAGKGGDNLYYADLIERLGLTANIYRVGTYKSAVEPYLRDDMSPEARENAQSLYSTLFAEWIAHVKKARPEGLFERYAANPLPFVEANDGSLARAAVTARIVDRIGTRIEWGEMVEDIAGEDLLDDTPGAFAHTEYDPWLVANPAETGGRRIGVVTVSGVIQDGTAGPGTAGGERIADLLDDALDEELAGLVVRVNSPGGSVTASEEIRRAILRVKAQGIPVAISMGNVAASGGYWVATPGDRIFAEPETITGSIGVFATLPSFEGALDSIGVNADGVATTPLTGEPDVFNGFSETTDALLQQTVEGQYARFLKLVADNRNTTPQVVDRVAQGRVWDGGAARQRGLVDQFGGLDTALEWVAAKAGLGDDWHAYHLADTGGAQGTLLQALMGGEGQGTHGKGQDLFAVMTAGQASAPTRLRADLERLLGTRGVQAYCLECPSASPVSPASTAEDASWLAALGRLFTR